MNLNPRYLPVYCCGGPSQRLGWVPVSRTRRRPGPIVFRIGHRSKDLMTGVVTEPARLHAEMLRFDDDGERILVVKGGEYPIDVWRKVPGFLEERPQ